MDDSKEVAMTTSTGFGAMVAALARAQAAFPAIERTRTVSVTTKSGAKYTFSYAPLDVILAAVRKPLSTNGLAITQLLVGTDLVTWLLHADGGRLESRVTLPLHNGASPQEIGSAITYLRRYAMQALLGIAAEEDDDGNAASGHHVEATRPEPARAAATPETGSVTGSITAVRERPGKGKLAGKTLHDVDIVTDGGGERVTVTFFDRADAALAREAQQANKPVSLRYREKIVNGIAYRDLITESLDVDIPL